MKATKDSDFPVSKEMADNRSRETGKMSYRTRIQLRIFLLYVLVAVLIIVPAVWILITKKGPDVRLVPDWFFSLAHCIYYGGIIYLLIRIHIFRKGLKDVWTLQKQYTNEYDERRRALHEKSGGWPIDIMIAGCCVAVEISWFTNNSSAGITAAAILALAVILRVVSYVKARNSG